MAPKRLIEDPPPAISSFEEEETDDEEEEQLQNGTIETHQNGTDEKPNNDEDGSADDDDDDEIDDGDDDEEAGKDKPDLPSKTSKPNTDYDSDDDSADTESGQPPSPSLSDFTIKLISPKHKPGSKLEQLKKEKDDEDERAKRGAGPGTGGSRRIWSDEDEIVILNGMIEYQNEKGKSPFVDISDFYGFVKESLRFNASTCQFSDKIRRLKKKYYADLEKNENGKEEMFNKPHDLEYVELAKKIWGAGAIDVESKSNASKNSGKNVIDGDGSGRGGVVSALAKLERGEVNGKEKGVSVKKGKRGSSAEVKGEGKEGNVKRRKRGLNEEANGGEEGNVKRWKKGWSEEVNGEGKGKGGKMEKQAENEELNGGEDVRVKKQKRVVNEEMNGEEEDSEDLWEKYPFLRASLQAEDLPEEVKERAMVMLGKVPKEKLVELEREWRSLMNAKLEFFMKEKELIAKLLKLALVSGLIG